MTTKDVNPKKIDELLDKRKKAEDKIKKFAEILKAASRAGTPIDNVKKMAK